MGGCAGNSIHCALKSYFSAPTHTQYATAQTVKSEITNEVNNYVGVDILGP